MYKLSKFTVNLLNSSNERLLYNTLIGKRSLCKLPAEYSDYASFETIIKNPDYRRNMTNALVKKGIIVHESEDENRKLYESFLSNISPSTLTLHINPTEKCNFRCKYCYESFEQGKMSLETQNDIITFVRQNLHKYTGLHVSWFGGEPLIEVESMRYLTSKFIDICKYHRVPYSAGITTNGYLLSQPLFNDLLDMNVKNFQITLDGIKEIHDSQRVMANGGKTFDRIVENLHQIHLSERRDFEILLRTNITKEIFDHLDEYIDTLQDICQNDTRFTVAFYKVGNWLGKADTEITDKIIDNLDDMQIVYDKLLNSNFSGRINFNGYYPGNGACYAGKRNMFLIRANGDVHKCTVNFEEQGTKVGNLNHGELELNNNYHSNIIDINNCSSFYDCFFAPVCMGTPCPSDKERGCPYVKDYIGVSLKILDKNYPLEIIHE